MLRGLGAKKGLFARIATSKGIIIARLEFEKAPLTVANFVGLSQGLVTNDVRKTSEPFYDGLKFHRVIVGYMIIGGDPKGDGSGNPGYYFRDEFHPDLKHDKPGILTMENNGPTTNGSQFIITLKESPVFDNKKPVFGEVIGGMEVVTAIQQGDTIRHIDIIASGKKAKQFDPRKIFEKNGFNNMLKK